MKEFILKLIFRCITSRKWRCRKRKAFFESLFGHLRDVDKKVGREPPGYITLDESNFRNACEKMSTQVSYYPFEKSHSINIEDFFTEQRSPYFKLNVEIRRISPLYDLIYNYGDYEVHVNGFDKEMGIIDFTYRSRVFHLLI